MILSKLVREFEGLLIIFNRHLASVLESRFQVFTIAFTELRHLQYFFEI